MKLEELRKNYKADILKIAEKYGVTNIRVFGSTARGDATDKSDVDLLAKFPPKTTFITFGKFHDELESKIGVKLDLLSENGVNKYIKDQIFSEAKYL